MRSQRIAVLLQSVADLRNWVTQNMESAGSLVGCDLILKIGHAYLTGQPLDLSSIYQALPHPEEVIRLEIQQMEKAGLLVLTVPADGAHATVALTPRFIALLADYQRKSESLFVVREELRRRQFFATSSHAELMHFAQSLYERFYDLGWLYLENFGAICFLMASLVKEAASLHGYKARIQSGYLEIAFPDSQFLLGGKGYAAPGQIEGHAACVIEEALIVDFGLGNVRRGYRRDFYWGLACDFRPNDNVVGKMVLPEGNTVTWKMDWQSPDSGSELKQCEPAAKELAQHYLNYFGQLA